MVVSNILSYMVYSSFNVSLLISISSLSTDLKVLQIVSMTSMFMAVMFLMKLQCMASVPNDLNKHLSHCFSLCRFLQCVPFSFAKGEWPIRRY